MLGKNFRLLTMREWVMPVCSQLRSTASPLPISDAQRDLTSGTRTSCALSASVS